MSNLREDLIDWFDEEADMAKYYESVGDSKNFSRKHIICREISSMLCRDDFSKNKSEAVPKLLMQFHDTTNYFGAGTIYQQFVNGAWSDPDMIEEV